MTLHHAIYTSLILTTSMLLACGRNGQSSVQSSESSVSQTSSSSGGFQGLPLDDASTTHFVPVGDCAGVRASQCMMFFTEYRDPTSGATFHEMDIFPYVTNGFYMNRFNNFVKYSKIDDVTITYWTLPAAQVMKALGIQQFEDVQLHQSWVASGLRTAFPNGSGLIFPTMTSPY